MKQCAYPHIFSPIKIKNTIFKNRIWSGPASTHLLYNGESAPPDRVIAYYANKAAGGAAVVTYSAVNMDFDGVPDPINPNENILDPKNHKRFRLLTSAVHAYDAKISLELIGFCYHHINEAGERTLLSVNGGYNPMMGVMTKAFTIEDFERIARTYADVAEAAVECGFDMLLVHGGHGLCVSQFYSDILNHRTDEFGPQNVENKMRFANMILTAIRERVGDKLLIEYRISGEEDPKTHTGYGVEDVVEMIKQIQDKIDIAHISTGCFYNGTEGVTMPTEFLPHGCNVHYAAYVKQNPDIHIPVLTIGALQNPEEIEGILADHRADIVAMTRGLISDAERVNKWNSELEDEVIPCIRCFHCLDFKRAHEFGCSVNPTVGREFQHSFYPIDSAPTSKMVAVIGGGPGGMEAAIVAARRGHRVTLFEKTSSLGGKLKFSEHVPFKKDLFNFMNYQMHMLKKLEVDVRLNTEATPDLIMAMKYDAVVSAIGANVVFPQIEGVSMSHVFTAAEAYEMMKDGMDIGTNIAVIGGGLVGCETALYLSENCGKKVALLEMKDEVALDEMYVTRDELLERMQTNVQVITGARCSRIDEKHVFYVDSCHVERSVECDVVIISTGMYAEEASSEEFRGCARFYASVGDCKTVSNVRNAVHTAYYAAMRI